MAPIDTFNKKVQAGEPYEAHQFLRTVVNRLVRGKKYDDALALLHRGSLTLSNYRHTAAGSARADSGDTANGNAEVKTVSTSGAGDGGSGGSGTDLAIYFLEVAEQAGRGPADVVVLPSLSGRDAVVALLETVDLQEPTRGRLVKRIEDWHVKLCIKAGGSAWGDPALRTALGDVFAVVGDVEAAERQYLLAYTPDARRKLIELLFAHYTELAADGTAKRHTSALLLSRAVLPLLTLDRPAQALDCATAFAGSLSSSSAAKSGNAGAGAAEELGIDVGGGRTTIVRVFADAPLVNFLQYLCLACLRARGKVDMYARLRNTYKAAIAEAEREAVDGTDTSAVWQDALTSIGQIYFGIRPQRSGNNMLAEMMGSLFGGGGGGGGGSAARSSTPQIQQSGLD